MLPILQGRLLQASFRGVPFKVEVGSKSGGRRLAPHEFPKRDTPYTEDMGRKGKTFAVTGYLVGPTFREDRDALTDAFDQEGPGTLVHPTLGEYQVACGPYSTIERREKGGFVEFEVQFLEAGSAVTFSITDATQPQVQDGATKLGLGAAAAGDVSLSAPIAPVTVNPGVNV